jgi:hypothetical protein
MDGRAVTTIALAWPGGALRQRRVRPLHRKGVWNEKLIPEIFPNKTVAGCVAGMVAQVCFSILVPFLIARAMSP